MTNLLRIFAVCLVLVSSGHGSKAKSPLPSQGIIPDEVTAVKIAEATKTFKKVSAHRRSSREIFHSTIICAPWKARVCSATSSVNIRVHCSSKEKVISWERCKKALKLG